LADGVFNNHDQQDCQEFIKLLLYGIHEEVEKAAVQNYQKITRPIPKGKPATLMEKVNSTVRFVEKEPGEI